MALRLPSRGFTHSCARSRTRYGFLRSSNGLMTEYALRRVFNVTPARHALFGAAHASARWASINLYDCMSYFDSLRGFRALCMCIRSSDAYYSGDAPARNATSSLPTAAARRFLHEFRSWRTQLQFRATVVSVATVVPAVAKGVKTTIFHTSRKTCVWFSKVWKRREKRSEKIPRPKNGGRPGAGNRSSYSTLGS